MPDGKPYRGMRGGNWYNGIVTNGVNDGHSRVSNRNPSYYRGPQDPNHPWYHIGFRIARNYSSQQTGINSKEDILPSGYYLSQNYPNPFNPVTTIKYSTPENNNIKLTIYDMLGKEGSVLVNEYKNAGT